MKKYFIALEPDKNLIQRVLSQKDEVLKLVGEQKYLSDPPHFTLIVFTSDKEAELKIVLEEMSKKIKKINITLEKLHIFYDDILTGGHSITYLISEENTKLLKKIQKEVVEAINPFNSREFIVEGSEKFKKMSEIEKKNVREYGFPFIGDIWIPHVTIASIEKDKFSPVFDMISKNKIVGNFSLESLRLYDISEATVLIKEEKLK